MTLKGKHGLAMFLHYELFWMNNKTIIEFGFSIRWRIMEISEEHPLDLHNASYDTQPHSLIVK